MNKCDSSGLYLSCTVNTVQNTFVKDTFSSHYMIFRI